MCDHKYDNPNTSMHTVACAHPLEKIYPFFRNIPTFPYIGGLFDVRPDSLKCGSCLNLTNKEGVHIYLTVIDRAPVPLGFVMSVEACNKLNVRELRDLTKIEGVPSNFCHPN